MESNSSSRGADDRVLFRQGFVAMLPLWAGAVPAGIAFGVAAHTAGLSVVEAQLMSLLVFSSAAQISAVARDGLDQSTLLLIVTVIALNAQLPLLGAAVSERCAPTRRQRFITAWFLTDGAFGVAAGRGPLRLPVLLGAGVSMYLAWNTGTGLGLLAGDILPASVRSGLDLIVPLMFLAVLVPLIRSRTAFAVALSAAVTAWSMSQIVPAGIAVLLAGVVGVIVQDWRSRHE